MRTTGLLALVTTLSLAGSSAPAADPPPYPEKLPKHFDLVYTKKTLDSFREQLFRVQFEDKELQDVFALKPAKGYESVILGVTRDDTPKGIVSIKVSFTTTESPKAKTIKTLDSKERDFQPLVSVVTESLKLPR